MAPLSLCAICTHRKQVVSAKGSEFLLCMLSQQDRRFPKYPPQPVVRCTGFDASEAADSAK